MDAAEVQHDPQEEPGVPDGAGINEGPPGRGLRLPNVDFSAAYAKALKFDPTLRVSSLAKIGRYLDVPNQRMAAAMKIALKAGEWEQSAMSRIISGSSLATSSIRVAQLSGIGDERTKRVGRLIGAADFGVSGANALMAKQLAERQSRIWDLIGRQLRDLGQPFLPPNLQGIEDIDLGAVEQVVFIDGLPLFIVPRQEIAELLLKAENLEGRRTILDERWSDIAADCREAMDTCSAPALSGYRTKVLEALDAFEAGYISPAQALASSILESLVWDYFDKDHKRREPYVPDKRGKRTSAAYERLGSHEFVALAPIWQAFQPFNASAGDPVPSTFSRHASAHTINEIQFTRVNALLGLMIVSSILAFMQEVSRVEEAA